MIFVNILGSCILTGISVMLIYDMYKIEKELRRIKKIVKELERKKNIEMINLNNEINDANNQINEEYINLNNFLKNIK